MGIDKVCQDSNALYSRLFDHRPFLNGEIQHFTREFEDKRGNKDIQSLLKSLEIISELNAELNTNSEDVTNVAVKNLINSVDETTALIESIYSFESSAQEAAQFLEKEKARQKIWHKIVDDNASKLIKVENLIREKELEHRQYYHKLEEKLKAGLLP